MRLMPIHNTPQGVTDTEPRGTCLPMMIGSYQRESPYISLSLVETGLREASVLFFLFLDTVPVERRR